MVYIGLMSGLCAFMACNTADHPVLSTKIIWFHVLSFRLACVAHRSFQGDKTKHNFGRHSQPALNFCTKLLLPDHILLVMPSNWARFR